MAKQTALTLVNRVLRRLNQTEVSDISTATGHGKHILDMLNEGQNYLFTAANWYGLYATRVFNTVNYTASTIAFNNANPDTITDSANGMGNLQAGQILVSGSTSNDGTYNVSTAAVGTLTLQTSDVLTAESAGQSVTITQVTYPVASDWGRTKDITDITNNRILSEESSYIFDMDNPAQDVTGTPEYFSIEGNYIRFYQIPAGTYKMRERYWRVPTAFSSNTDTTILPIECENLLIFWAWIGMLEYQNKFTEADRRKQEFAHMLEKAESANRKILNRMEVMRSGVRDNAYLPMEPPRFGSHYPRWY